MRLQLIVVILLSLVSPVTIPQQRGRVSSVTATDDVGVGTIRFAVRGANPCGAVNLDYGDGLAMTYAIRDLPLGQTHEYTRIGDYTVRARGMGNCDGAATISVRITSVRPQPQPPTRQQPPLQPPGAVPRPANRFSEMDRNGDQIITRTEWRSSSASFDVHDWNGDGRLSGEEVRMGAIPPIVDRGRESGGFSDWSDARYDDRGDRFDDLDLNRDNRIEGREWHGSADAFRWMDRNNDGWLSRFEVVGAEPSPPSYPGSGQGRGGGRGANIVVSSQQSWTDTGITVRAGDSLRIRANGVIQFSGKSSDVAEPDGAPERRATNQAPLPDVVIGALVGRIGNSPPFFVGSDSQGLRAPRDGRLYLGVNDDILRDNRGEFRVILTTGRGGGD